MTTRAVVACAMVLAMTACMSSARRAKGPNAKPIPDKITHALCTSDMGGDAAAVQVWRTNDGAFVVLELQPDLVKHGAQSPTTYFDANGGEVLRIESHTGAPSSPEALEADRRRDSVTVDGGKAEIIRCKGK